MMGIPIPLISHCHWDRMIYIDGLVQDCSISIANALEILPSCTKPSIYIHQRTRSSLVQIIIWINYDVLSIDTLSFELLRTNFNEISFKMQKFSARKMFLNNGSHFVSVSMWYMIFMLKWSPGAQLVSNLYEWNRSLSLVVLNLFKEIWKCIYIFYRFSILRRCK